MIGQGVTPMLERVRAALPLSAAPPRVTAPEKGSGPAHLPALDGWRGISILFVMAAHLLPLGPKAWQLNATFAVAGMNLFFILSGFLITNILARRPAVIPFLIRRIFRIVPLAWAFLVVVLALNAATAAEWRANFLFYANLPPFYLQHAGHFWSLCVEMQFYVVIALIVAFAGRRGVLLVPLLALAVTGTRIATGTELSIVTWLRVDEILAGGCLALVRRRWPGLGADQPMLANGVYLLFPLLLLSSHPALPWLAYVKPYVAAALIGITLDRAPVWVAAFLGSRSLRYVAQVSFALYVIHPMTMYGWVGEGSPVVRYAKRPLCFAIAFAFAHVSTFYYEKWWIRQGHRLAARFE